MHSSFDAVKDLHKPPKASVGHQDPLACKAWAALLAGVRMAKLPRGPHHRSFAWSSAKLLGAGMAALSKKCCLGHWQGLGFGRAHDASQAELGPSHTVSWEAVFELL